MIAKRIINKAFKEDKLPSEVANIPSPFDEEVDWHYLFGDMCFSFEGQLYFFDDSPIELF